MVPFYIKFSCLRFESLNTNIPNEYLTKTMGSGLTASMPTSLQKTIRIHETNDIAKCKYLHAIYLNNYTQVAKFYS